MSKPTEAERSAGRIIANGVRRRRHKNRVKLNELRRQHGQEEVPNNARAKLAFTIVCNECGGISCGMGTWHNDIDSGFFIKCDNCGQTERY